MDIDDEQEKDSLSGSWDRIITDTSTKQPNFMKHTIASAKRQSLGNKIKRDRQIVDLRKEFSSISITSGSKQVSKAIQKQQQQQQQQQPGGTEKLESNKKEKRKRKPLKINTIILESNENQFNLPPSEEKVTIPSRCLPKQSLRRQEFTTKRKSKAKLALQNMNMQIWPENNPLKSPTHTTKETKVVDENKRTKQHDTSKKMHVHKKRVLQKALYMSKLNEIIKEFRQEHKGSLIRAHLAYKADCPDKIFILAYVHCPIKTKMWRLYKGLKVLFMDYLYVDSEAIRVAADKKSSTMKLSETVENELRKSITKHAHDLMSSHSNLQILSGSPVRSKQKGQVIKEEQCIVLFCRNKGYIPLGEKRFPNKIDRFSVDVREGFFQWSPSENQLASEYQSHLRMGCSIGTKGNLHKGSLGGFVDTERGMGFLTCAHVVYNTHELFNQSTISPNATIVVQPADGELMPNDIRDRECGTVLRHAFDPNSNVGVDCAVVNITKRKPDFAEFCNLNEDSLRKTGFRPNEILRYTNGKIVNNPHHRHYRDRRLIKCGRTTGLRRGVFEFNGAAVRVDEVLLGLDRSATAFICLKGQYVVQLVGRTFVDEGDSGALVFLLKDDNSLSCVGMVEGVTSNFLAVITPITEILKKLRLDPTKLCVFPEGVMETD